MNKYWFGFFCCCFLVLFVAFVCFCFVLFLNFLVPVSVTYMIPELRPAALFFCWLDSSLHPNMVLFGYLYCEKPNFYLFIFFPFYPVYQHVRNNEFQVSIVSVQKIFMQL